MDVNRPNEGTAGLERDLMLDLFSEFEELCEIEGPGAADTGDLCRLKHKMTDAFAAGDCSRFLGLLAKAMCIRDGMSLDDSNAESH
jgi:hypothetical protein